MKKNLFLITALTISGAILSQPSVTAMSPLVGPIGTNLVISGTGFNANAAQNVVYFGATKATVSNASANSLSVTVPLGANHKAVSVLNFSTGLSGYSNSIFNTSYSCGSSLALSTFANYVAYAVAGGGERNAKIADLDGDGKSEMVVANRSGGYVSVFRNTSTPGILNAGSFAPKIDLLATTPIAVTVMDMDGDGKLDIITCSYDNSVVSVLRNTSTVGNISFATFINYATGSGPYGITTGDIDYDGKPEIITGNYGQGGMSVIRNASTVGNLSFGTKIDFVGSGQCHNVDVADIDGDGKIEIVVASRLGNLVSVYRNTSTTGTITVSSLAAKVDFSTPSAGGEDVVAGDVDGDGKMDLTVCGSGNSVTILRNTATSGIINAASFAAGVSFGVGSSSYGMSLGDVNGDGKPDVVPCSSTSGVSMLQNVSTVGTVSLAPVINFAGNIGGFNSAVGDLDNDGKNDVINAPLSGTDINVYRNIVGVSAVSTVTNITCNSLCNAAIMLSTSASTSSVIWSNSSTSYSLTNLCSGLYSYSLTTGTCVATGSVNIIQPAALTLSLASTNSVVCSGNSSTLTSNAAGGTGALTYSWSSGPTATVITVTPTVATVYTVSVLDANACSISSSISVNVSANPTVSIVSSNSVACLGGSITLTANGASTYTWNTASNSASIAISPTATTVYTVTGLSAAGCSGANNSSTISLNVAPSPTVAAVSSASIICAGNSATLTASGAVTYSWSNGANNASTVVSPTTNATYTVTGIAANGCENSTVISQSVSACTGLQTNAISNSNVNLFPNPNNGTFKLEVSDLFANSHIEIYNNLGQLVYTSPVNTKNNEINISQLSNGLYTVKLISENSIMSTQKMIKQ